MIREGVMKKLLFPFFLICCAVPLTAEAADLFNTNGSFKVAKAVKLGRGSAYSVSASSNVNTGGKISSKKTCSAGCSDCDTTTGTCTGSNGGSSSSSGSSSSCTPTIGYTCVNGVKTKCMYEGCASCATDTLKCVSCKPGYAYTAGSNCSS